MNVRTTRDFVQECDVVNVSFTAFFSHPNAQHIFYGTNFVERISPQIKHIIDNFYDEYCMHVVLNTNQATSATTDPPPPPQPTSRHVNESLGSSRRVMHEHHYQGQTCAVCHSLYKQNEFIRTLPACKHFFHKRCIDPWIKRNHTPTCPICRAVVLLPPPQTSSSPPETPRPSVESTHPSSTEPSPRREDIHTYGGTGEDEEAAPPSPSVRPHSTPDTSASTA